MFLFSKLRNENKIKKSIATFAAYATKHATTF